MKNKCAVKSGLIVLLMTVLLLMSQSIQGRAEETSITEGDWKYIVNDNSEAVIIDYIGNDKDVVIPETLGGYVVTSIHGEDEVVIIRLKLEQTA